MPADNNHRLTIAWIPDLLYVAGSFQSGLALIGDSSGLITGVIQADELKDEKRMRLQNRAMLPGMINAHSHAFQRLLRGRTEFRTAIAGASPLPNTGVSTDSFWTWREMMYSAAARLSPADVYDASRMAFLEMALGGITAVGEFHYLHHQSDGTPYDDPNLLAKEVISAAREVGLRIALLKVAYARAGFQTEPNPRQSRFIENSPEIFLTNLQGLADEVSRGTNPIVREDSLAHKDRARASSAWIGIAPHSVRAVPLDYLRAVIGYAAQHNLKVHMHVAEQPAEVSACVQEHGRTPIALLETEGLLSQNFTAVHAIHVTPKAIPGFAKTGAMICACPTTERNLGDGVVPADEYFKHGVQVCLGTDSHAQIDLFEDARELEYHLRLQKLERAVLDPLSQVSNLKSQVTQPPGRDISPTLKRGPEALAERLFECATISGARSIGAAGGVLEIGKPADFFTVALDDPTIAGASEKELLATIMFSSSRVAVREVVVGGKPIVSEGRHLIQEEVVERFKSLQKRLWGLGESALA